MLLSSPNLVDNSVTWLTAEAFFCGFFRFGRRMFAWGTWA